MSLMYLVTHFLSKHVARECSGQRTCLHGTTFAAEAGGAVPAIQSADASIATVATVYVRLFIFIPSRGSPL